MLHSTMLILGLLVSRVVIANPKVPQVNRDHYAYTIEARLIDKPPSGMRCTPSKMLDLRFAVSVRDRGAAWFTKDTVVARIPCPNTSTNVLRRGATYYLSIWRYRPYAEWTGGPAIAPKPGRPKPKR